MSRTLHVRRAPSTIRESRKSIEPSYAERNPGCGRAGKWPESNADRQPDARTDEMCPTPDAAPQITDSLRYARWTGSGSESALAWSPTPIQPFPDPVSPLRSPIEPIAPGTSGRSEEAHEHPR